MDNLIPLASIWTLHSEIFCSKVGKGGITFSIHCMYNTSVKSDITDSKYIRVKSGIFRQTAKCGQPLCLFHSSVIME